MSVIVAAAGENVAVPLSEKVGVPPVSVIVPEAGKNAESVKLGVPGVSVIEPEAGE